MTILSVPAAAPGAPAKPTAMVAVDSGPSNGSVPIAEYSIPVGTGPSAITYDPTLGELFVANSGSDNVSVLNDTFGNVTASLPVGLDPSALLVANGLVFVANRGSDNVTVIEPSRLRVLGSLAVGGEPDGLAVDEGANGAFDLLVANNGTDNLTVIPAENQTFTRSTSIDVGLAPSAVEQSGPGPIAYVLDSGSSSLTQVDVTRLVANATFGVGAGPSAEVLTSGGPPCNFESDLFVANAGSDNLSVVSLNDSGQVRTVGTVPVGSSPDGEVADPATCRVYVANAGSDNVSVVDGVHDRVLAETIPTGAEPTGLALDGAKGCLFIADHGSNNVTVACGVVPLGTHRSIPAPLPMALLYDPGTQALYVGMQYRGLGVVDSSTGALANSSLPLLSPGALAYDARDHAVFEATTNGTEQGLTEVNDTSGAVVRFISLGSEGSFYNYTPCNVVYDPMNGYLYAEEDRGIAVVAAAGGQVEGWVQVAGGFSGAACGLGYDSLDGQVFFESATPTCSLEINGLNGSSTDWNATDPVLGAGVCLVPRIDRGYGSDPTPIAFDPATDRIYVADWVSARRGSVNLSVVNASTGAVLPGIALPFGDTDSVVVDPLGEMFVASYWNITVVDLANGTVVGTIGCGEGPTAIVFDPTTSELYTANYETNNLTVVPVGPNATLGPATPLSFAESGTPAGAEWDVVVAGHDLTSSTNVTPALTLPGGPATFSAAGPVGFHAVRSTGFLLLSGSSVSVRLAFVRNSSTVTGPPTFSVTFAAVGLTAGANWSVTLRGVTYFSNGSSDIVVERPNGTYAFLVHPPVGWTVEIKRSSVLVFGASVQVPVQFVWLPAPATAGSAPMTPSLASWELWVPVAAAGVAISVAGALEWRSRRRST